MTPEEEKKKGGSRVAKRGKRPRRKRTREEVIRLRVIILFVVSALLLAGAIGLSLWIREPDLPEPNHGGDVFEPGIAGAPAYAADRKEGVYTFLIMGRDTGGGGNTDTLMVATYDTRQQSVNVLNIYRDTMVNAPWDIKRINSVYNFNGGGEKGVNALRDYLAKLVGFRPDYYITVEWRAVGELVDAIGGVEFDVPYEMHYYDPTQNLRIDQAKGYRTLYGDDAMQVIRWRKNNDGSGTSVGEVGRVAIQQDFLKAVVQKCLGTINLSTVPKFAEILLENVETDIPLGTIVWFGQRALGLDMNNLGFHSLPGKLNGAAWSRSYKNYQSYVLPDGPALVELVNTYFNPYTEDVQLTDLDIMSVNSDGSLSCTGGAVRDTEAAKPPVKPAAKPKPEQPAESQAPSEEGDPPVTSPIPEDSETMEGESGGDVGEPSGEAGDETAGEDSGGKESDLPPEFRPENDIQPVATPEPTPVPTPEPTPEVDIPPEFLPAVAA